MPPGGLPEVFLEGAPDALDQLVARYARGRGPFTTAQANERFGRDVEPLLQQLERQEKLVRGELRPGGTEREWCDPDVLRRLRRASLAALRKEVEPAEQAAFGRFLPHWHGIDRRATLREALVPLQGLSLPVALWESDVLPRRVPGFNPGQLDQLCASGEVVWVGAGLDRVAVFFREDAPALGRPAAAARPEGEAHDKIREALGRSAEFWYDLVTSTGLEAEVALPALWDLVWAGEVTNDAWTPLRAGRRYQSPKATQRGRPRRFSRQRSAGITATQGRWSLTDKLFPGRPDRAPSPSCCSSVRGSSRATASAAKGSPVGTARCTASCVRSRRSASADVATSSRASAAPSSPSRARWNDFGSCVRARTRRRNRSSFPPRTRHSPTVRACPGRSEREHGRRVSPVRRSSCSAVSRRSSSSAAASHSSRCVIRGRLAPRCVEGARRARQEGRVEETTGGRALRRRARRRDRDHAFAARGRLSRRPSACSAASLADRHPDAVRAERDAERMVAEVDRRLHDSASGSTRTRVPAIEARNPDVPGA